MPRLERPLDGEAVESADEQIYAAHEDDKRPNALYDANGNRRRLSATDPSQEALRQEWREYYLAALKDKKESAEEAPETKGSAGSGPPPSRPGSSPPASNSDPGEPVAPCKEKHYFIVQVKLKLPDDPAALPPFWPTLPNESAFFYEFYKAKTPDGPDESYLDSSATTKYTELLGAGACQIVFPEAFTELKEYFDAVVRG